MTMMMTMIAMTMIKTMMSFLFTVAAAVHKPRSPATSSIIL